MNRENYKKSRNKPKPSNAVSKARKQMRLKPVVIVSTATPKLREIYSTRTEWITKVIPKIKTN